MPTVYKRSEHIQELNGDVRNGLAIVAHSPADVLALEGLVDTVGRLPGDTLDNLYRILARAGREPDIWPGAETTDDNAGDLGVNEESLERLDKRARALRVSLALGRVAWRAQEDDVDQLSMALMLPRPGRRAVMRSKRPALVLDYGSIRARVLAAGGKLRDFGVALFPVARSKRRANVVEALRDQAKGLRLPRLETIQPSDLDGKTGVVIFLHGLMSTDVGTFDQFVSALGASPIFGQSRLLVSWPHDTLASIDTNAEDLSVLIEEKLGRSSLPIAFVCHSRGGLVARKTAVELMEIDRERWRPRLRGLVTFGTPHNGAELAEAGDEFLGKVLLGFTVAKQAGVLPLVDALWSVKDHKKLAGVTDLRPRSNGGNFLQDLRRAESRIAKKAGVVPLRLYAVGGDCATNTITGMLTRRYFGGANNDLIVTQESSTPAAAERRAETTCDHFGYFTETAVAGDAVTDTFTFLQLTMAPIEQEAPADDAQSRLPQSPRPIKYDPAKVAAGKSRGNTETRSVSP
jgi:hypothetical protein